MSAAPIAVLPFQPDGNALAEPFLFRFLYGKTDPGAAVPIWKESTPGQHVTVEHSTISKFVMGELNFTTIESEPRSITWWPDPTTDDEPTEVSSQLSNHLSICRNRLKLMA